MACALPGLTGAGGQAQTLINVAEMVPDGRIIASGQSGGALELLAGVVDLALAKQHPAETIDIGGVVLIALLGRAGETGALPAVQLERLANQLLGLAQVF